MIDRIKSLLWIFSRIKEYIYIDGGENGDNKSSKEYIIFYSNTGYLEYKEYEVLRKILND